MFDDIDQYYGTEFSILWERFIVDNYGNVINNDGEEIGHIEDCLEAGWIFMELIELIEKSKKIL